VDEPHCLKGGRNVFGSPDFESGSVHSQRARPGLTKRAQSASEGVEFLFIRSRCSEKSNSGDVCRVLRSCGQRPNSRRAAETVRSHPCFRPTRIAHFIYGKESAALRDFDPP
jgi:hypothetical protein